MLSSLHFLRSTQITTVFILLGFLYYTCFQYLITQQPHGLFSSGAVCIIFWLVFVYLVGERQTVPQRQVLLDNNRLVRCPLLLGGQIKERLGWKTWRKACLSPYQCIFVINQGMQVKEFSRYNNMCT